MHCMILQASDVSYDDGLFLRWCLYEESFGSRWKEKDGGGEKVQPGPEGTVLSSEQSLEKGM